MRIILHCLRGLGGNWLCSLGLGLFVVLIRVEVRVVVCVRWGSGLGWLFVSIGVLCCANQSTLSHDIRGEFVVRIRVRVVRIAH